MKRFSFNLQKLMDIREIRRHLAEEKLGQALGEKVRAEEELGRAVSEEEQAGKVMAGMTRGAVNIALVQHALRYKTSTEEEVARCRKVVKQAEDKFESARAEAFERINEHEVILRLRKRKFEGYLDAYWWEYSKTLDEVGLLRHVRRRRVP